MYRLILDYVFKIIIKDLFETNYLLHVPLLVFPLNLGHNGL